MTKQELLAWIQSLPDDAEALPFQLSEIVEDSDDWKLELGLTGSTFPTVYQKHVRTEMTLRLRFTGLVQGEFKRDNFGSPRWANIRRIN